MTAEFKPIATLHDLWLQNPYDVHTGYLCAAQGFPPPDMTCSRGFHHGYNCALIDAGKMPLTPEMAHLMDEVESRKVPIQ